MIYSVLHRTTYAYQSEVTFARCVLRLTPRTSPDQTLLANAIELTPAPSSSVESVGAFGEAMRQVIVDTPHRELVIEARSRVEVNAPPIALAFATSWETVRTRSLASRELTPEGPASYLYPTARTPILAQITDYARISFPPGRAIIEAAGELMSRIREDFKYDPGATDVSTPAAVAFEARHGVCQDFAHIMICGLRGLGLPAGYVSGYLRTRQPGSAPRLQGADATHAWVQLWCGEASGWIGFDPTNAVMVRNDHIVLAIGRDYADAAPIDGILLSPGQQTLEVEVDVAPEAALAG
ncbi:MAG TPA: transglutaminase family protein [Caulobacteraceae bacterium]